MPDKIPQHIIERVKRLNQIFQESAEIIRNTKNKDTELSRIDVAIKCIIDLKGLKESYPIIEIENLHLIDYQLTKAKYDLIKNNFEKT